MKNIDLKITILVTFLCIPFVLIPQLNESPLRIIFGLPLLLFLPGYSLIAMLFPRHNDLDVYDCIALSFGLSVIVVSLLGLVLNYTPFGIRLTSVLFALSTFTISLSVIAWIRRLKLTDEERFRVPFDRLLKFNLGQNKLDKTLSIVLIAALIFSFTTLFYALVIPNSGERFTEFYILGSNDLATDYPTDLKIGEKGELIIGVVNHEYDNITYRIVVNFNDRQIYDYHVFLIDTEMWETTFTILASEKGENQKLEFLLYKNHEVYRTLHLWINIT